MSSVLDLINDNQDYGWEVQQSKKNEKQRKQNQDNIEKVVSKEQTINQTINQVINQTINQPINQPVNQPVNQSVNQPVNQSINEPINQPINVQTNQLVNIVDNQILYDNWFNTMQVKKTILEPVDQWYQLMLMNHMHMSKYIAHMKNELMLPEYLKLKSENDKKMILGNQIYNYILTIENSLYENLKKENKWSENITANKITELIMDNNSIIQALSIFNNKNDLMININIACNILYKNYVKPVTEVVKPVTEVVKPITEVVKPIPEVVKPIPEVVKPVTESVKKISVQEVIKSKSNTISDFVAKKTAALMAAQEKFYIECVPSEEKIKSVMAILEVNHKNKLITANKISLEEDIITIDNFKFSKTHYLGNPFFRNKVIKEYVRIFSDKYWVKLTTHSKFLIIMLDFNHNKKEGEKIE